MHDDPLTTGDLRDRIIRLGPWHHDVEVAPGIRTGDPAPAGMYPTELGTPSLIDPERSLADLLGGVYPEGFGGRSVLDCACNAGGYLFAAARLGAGRSFGFDVRSHWIDQARFLSEHLRSDHIEFATLDLAALPDRRLAPFDVTLFFGLFYHLPDPIAGLRIAAEHTRELLIVNTATCPGPAQSLVLNRESETELMSGVHGLAWLPTDEGVLRQILQWCGFPHARLHFDAPADGNRRRIAILAAREAATFAHYDASQSRGADIGGRLRRLFGRA
jgi:tRNA (mo5U34)-methyltransferase